MACARPPHGGRRAEAYRSAVRSRRRLPMDIEDACAFSHYARRILVAAMQRLASKPNNDLTSTLVPLPSEEMKGKTSGCGDFSIVFNNCNGQSNQKSYSGYGAV